MDSQPEQDSAEQGAVGESTDEQNLAAQQRLNRVGTIAVLVSVFTFAALGVGFHITGPVKNPSSGGTGLVIRSP